RRAVPWWEDDDERIQLARRLLLARRSPRIRLQGRVELPAAVPGVEVGVVREDDGHAAPQQRVGDVLRKGFAGLEVALVEEGEPGERVMERPRARRAGPPRVGDEDREHPPW